ncbi:hypothetical protein ACFYXC_13110 [Streptomyces sp. NPDC002701]|uniref:hypothetical protein n=1 Tax=Streptomyces sp. NPDC002701 TaxID=3364661 RepID=UPI0036944604
MTRFEWFDIPTRIQEETVRKAALGLFMALMAVLAVAPLADADQTQIVACCGPNPPGWP